MCVAEHYYYYYFLNAFYFCESNHVKILFIKTPQKTSSALQLCNWSGRINFYYFSLQ